MAIDISQLRKLPLFQRLVTRASILSAWEGRGLVEGGRQRLTVCDAERLAGIADPSER